MPLVRSDRPVPRLSNRISRENEASLVEELCRRPLPGALEDREHPAADEHEVQRSVPHHGVRDVDVAALCVPDVRESPLSDSSRDETAPQPGRATESNRRGVALERDAAHRCWLDPVLSALDRVSIQRDAEALKRTASRDSFCEAPS